MVEPINGHEHTPQPAAGLVFAADQNTGQIVLVARFGPMVMQLNFGGPDEAEQMIRAMATHGLQLVNDLRQARNLSGIVLPGMPDFINPKGVDPEALKRFQQGEPGPPIGHPG